MSRYLALCFGYLKCHWVEQLMSGLRVLKERIASGSVVVGIYGLGYVGLPLALRFSEVGIKEIGRAHV